MFIIHILCNKFITQHGPFFEKKYFKIQLCKADISKEYQKLDVFFFRKKYLLIKFCKAGISKAYQKLDWYVYLYLIYIYISV